MAENTITIATKVSYQTYAIIDSILQKYNIKRYKMLQVIIDAYIRYLDTKSHISDYMRNAINGFADFRHTETAFTICGGLVEQMQIKSGIFFLEKKRATQKQPVLIEKGKNGELLQTFNYDSITKEFLNSIDPELFSLLSDMKQKENLLSVTDALKMAIRDTRAENGDIIYQDIKEMFADNGRSECGKNLGYEEEGQYIKHRGKSLNNI